MNSSSGKAVSAHGLACHISGQRHQCDAAAALFCQKANRWYGMSQYQRRRQNFRPRGAKSRWSGGLEHPEAWKPFSFWTSHSAVFCSLY